MIMFNNEKKIMIVIKGIFMYGLLQKKVLEITVV